MQPPGSLGGFLPSMLMPHNTGRKQRLQHMVHEMGHPPEGVGGKGDSELCLEGHPAWRLSYHLLSRENEQDAFSLACESLAVREDGVFAS